MSRTTATGTATSTLTTTSQSSTSHTVTATSRTQSSTTQTRQAPPVQVMSLPEEVQTVDATLLLLGANDSMPDIEQSLQGSISQTIGVDPRRRPAQLLAENRA